MAFYLTSTSYNSNNTNNSNKFKKKKRFETLFYIIVKACFELAAAATAASVVVFGVVVDLLAKIHSFGISRRISS